MDVEEEQAVAVASGGDVKVEETKDENNMEEHQGGGTDGKEEENEQLDIELEFDSDEEYDEVEIKGTYHEHRARSSDLSEESKAHILWRLDKGESFSDWSIEVTVCESGGCSKTTYHVHRSVLAAGPRKSGYFETLFKSDQFKESENSRSDVSLTEDTAQFFPSFLDYLYCPPNECKNIIKRENWLALKYFASYFIVPKLTKDITDFVKDDVQDLSCLEEYLVEYCESEDESSKAILAQAARVCTEIILHIGISTTLLYSLPPAMLFGMFEKLRSSGDIKSLPSDKQYHICQLAVDYINTHEKHLNEAYFDALTRQLYFPDDVKHARNLAIDILNIAKNTGWCDINGAEIDINILVALSRYLADENNGPDFEMIHDIADKLPIDATKLLFAEAICAKRRLATESYT
eukprot:10574478-Ditylum_brightwellii.AAC.1